jgi:group I intron endonuclease
MGCGIYRIDIGSSYYFGRAKDLARRERQHKWALEENRHSNPKMQNAFNKYGEFAFQVVARCPEEYLDKMEAYFINQHFDKPECMNLMTADDDGRYVWSEETKRKRSIANKGTKPSRKCIEASLASRVGKKLSEDHRRKISESSRGHSVSSETREKIAASKRGKPFPGTPGAGIAAAHKVNRLPCVLITPGGFPLLFDSQIDATDYLGVKPGSLASYFSGRNPWPPVSSKSRLAGWAGERIKTRTFQKASA